LVLLVLTSITVFTASNISDFIMSAFFHKIDFMLDGLLVFGINPRFYVYYIVIADPSFWFACCYLEMVSFFSKYQVSFVLLWENLLLISGPHRRWLISVVYLLLFCIGVHVMVYSSQSISGKFMFPHTHMVSLGYLLQILIMVFARACG
jgi:hypothetical protein